MESYDLAWPPIFRHVRYISVNFLSDGWAGQPSREGRLIQMSSCNSQKVGNFYTSSAVLYRGNTPCCPSRNSIPLMCAKPADRKYCDQRWTLRRCFPALWNALPAAAPEPSTSKFVRLRIGSLQRVQPASSNRTCLGVGDNRFTVACTNLETRRDLSSERAAM
jgi:hypothetical protein